MTCLIVDYKNFVNLPKSIFQYMRCVHFSPHLLSYLFPPPFPLRLLPARTLLNLFKTERAIWSCSLPFFPLFCEVVRWSRDQFHTTRYALTSNFSLPSLRCLLSSTSFFLFFSIYFLCLAISVINFFFDFRYFVVSISQFFSTCQKGR